MLHRDGYSGAGMKKISRTSPCPPVAPMPLRAHATASSMSAHSKIQKPPMCSLASRYGPSVTTTWPSVGFCSDFVAPRPQANFLTPAASISLLSAWIAGPTDSSIVDGSKSSGRYPATKYCGIVFLHKFESGRAVFCFHLYDEQ